MQIIPPITFTDISILLAVAGIILAISYQLTSPYFGLTNMIINRKKLRSLALIVGILFIFTVVINISNALDII